MRTAELVVYRIGRQINKNYYRVQPYTNVKTKAILDEYYCNTCDDYHTTDFAAMAKHIRSNCMFTGKQTQPV